MENSKLKNNILNGEKMHIPNQKPYDSELFRKRKIFPKSMAKIRLLMLANEVQEM